MYECVLFIPLEYLSNHTRHRPKARLAANVASGVACCCLLLALLVREPTAVALGTAAMLMVSADMFGALLLLRIPINIVTVFSLLFATGLSVDSIGHVAHALAGRGGPHPQPEHVVRKALLHSAAPVLLAVLTSVVAFLPTFAAITPTLLQYTLILISLLLLSLLHAVLFIPAAFLLISRAKRVGGDGAAEARRGPWRAPAVPPEDGAKNGRVGWAGRRHAGDGDGLLELASGRSSSARPKARRQAACARAANLSRASVALSNSTSCPGSLSPCV